MVKLQSILIVSYTYATVTIIKKFRVSKIFF